MKTYGMLLVPKQKLVLMVQPWRELGKIVPRFFSTVNQSIQEEIQILRLMLYREDVLPTDPACCIHCGPLLQKIVLLEQKLAASEEQSAA